MATVGVDDPDVVAAAAVRGERDALAIGREARLLVPRHTLRDGRGFAARDRQGVEVAEQVEDQGLAVGRHVDVHQVPSLTSIAASWWGPGGLSTFQWASVLAAVSTGAGAAPARVHRKPASDHRMRAATIRGALER